MVKLVVEYLGLLPLPFQLCQGFETAGFIDKAAVLLVSTMLVVSEQIAALGNQVVGLPQEFDGLLTILVFNLAEEEIGGVVAIRQYPATHGMWRRTK
ncbi:hypothetical protein [Aeromonas caviae]